MKYTYPRGYLALKDFVKGSGLPGYWKLRRDGKHRQFLTDWGEILNYRDDSKAVWFQGREDGPLHKWFASAHAAKSAARQKAARARLDPETERRAIPLRSTHLTMIGYHALKVKRAKSVSETAHKVSQVLADALQRADGAMTLPQLSLALAAISVDIVSSRRKPDLRGRIERILLDISEDEFCDEDLDESDQYIYD